MALSCVLPLSRCSNVSLVGGKAAGIARLLEAGIPVPDGCCLTTRAYEHSLKEIGFASHERWRRALTQRGKNRSLMLGDCRDMIRRADLTDHLKSIREELQRLGLQADQRWAVRSSASNEDMVRASGAGLYRTILGTQLDGLAGSIVDVWTSLWEEAVMDYMLKWGTADVPPAMAVVIQPLLDAKIAGVASSMHPTTGRDIHVTINAVRGLGGPLVGGSVTPDHYIVETTAGRPVRVVQRIPGQQREQLIAGSGGLAMERIPSAEQHQPSLSDEHLFEIAALAKRIEELFHSPVDVEWALEAERLWALQARPLTAVQASSDLANENCEWSRANFKETMPELPSPMGLSFLEHFMDVYILSHYRRLGCRIPSGLRSVRVYAGRPYLNVTLFHILVGQLGGDPSLNAEQMGGSPIQSPPAVRPLPWPVLMRAGWFMWREMRRVVRDGPRCFLEMKELAARYSRDHTRQLSLTEAGARLDELGRWLSPREMTFGIVAGAGQCLQAFSRLLPSWLGPDWRRLLNESLQGQGTVISAQQILDVAALVALAREDVAVSTALRRGWEPGGYRVSFEGSRFLSAFDRYLEDYGHRAVGESDIMTARLADQPELLLDVIKAHLEGTPMTPGELIERQRTVRERALAAIKARCGWRVDRWLMFRWWYRRLCRYFALREANRHHLMWYSLAARHLLLRVGELLVEQGVFGCSEDIFFLTLREREALEKGPWDTWTAITQARRAEREGWKGLDAPDHLRNWDDPERPSPPSLLDAGGALAGIPVSSGIASGPVRFVRTTMDWKRVHRGDIVVAEVIDPGMAPLFGIAGGLIAEMGGSLSHGAIIAREYGLPAITNVVHAMQLLSEDEYVTVDAVWGVVRRHKGASGRVAESLR
jgi:phosphohistidine swiveling domain-containing protein